MNDPAIPRNGFLIPDAEKCHRHIGEQRTDAPYIRIHVYNRKTGKHEPLIISPEDFFGGIANEIQSGE